MKEIKAISDDPIEERILIDSESSIDPIFIKALLSLPKITLTVSNEPKHYGKRARRNRFGR